MPFAKKASSIPSISAIQHENSVNNLCRHCATKLPVGRVYVKEAGSILNGVPFIKTKTGYKPNFYSIPDNPSLIANWKVAYGTRYEHDSSLPSRVHINCYQAIKRKAQEINSGRSTEHFTPNDMFNYRSTTNRVRHISGEDDASYQCRLCDYVSNKHCEHKNKLSSEGPAETDYVAHHNPSIRKRNNSGSRGPLKKPRNDEGAYYDKTKLLKPNEPAKQSVCNKLLPRGTGQDIFCKGVTGPGRSHDCRSKKSVVAGNRRILRESGVEEQVISSCINERRTSARNSTKPQRLGFEQLSSNRPLQVEINSREPRQLQMHQAINMAREQKLSQRQLDGVLSTFREVHGRKSVAFTTKELRDNIMNRTHDLFTTTELWLPSKLGANERNHRWYDRPNLRKSSTPGQEAERLVEIIHVHDLRALIEKVSEHRGYTSDCALKFGLDHGQGSLKLTLSLSTPERPEFNSVNTMLIIAVANVEESVESVNVLLRLGQVESVMNTFKCTFCADHKVLRMIGGLLQGRPKYPLIICNWDAYDPEGACETRNLDTVTRDLEQLALGKEPKECNGLARRPEFMVPIYTKKLQVVPPPLHTYLGLFGKCFDEFKSKMSQKDEGKLVNEYVYGICNVQPTAYWRGSFEGNHVQKLLKNRKQLREMFTASKYQRFHDVLDSLANVAHLALTCRRDLSDDELKSIDDAIDDLYKKWTKAKINVTPKLHDLKCNGPKFMRETKNSLGFYSEQATESAHRYYKHFIARYTNVKTRERRITALSRYNAYAFDNNPKKFTRKSKKSTSSSSSTSITSSGIEMDMPVTEIDESEFFQDDELVEEIQSGVNEIDRVAICVEDHKQLEGSNIDGFVSTNFWPVQSANDETAYERIDVQTEKYIDSNGKHRQRLNVSVSSASQEDIENEPPQSEAYEPNYY